MLQKATEWILKNHLHGQALPLSHRQSCPSLEVTGYSIPTLLSIDEIALAEQFALWLVSRQNPDGSFSVENHISPVFATGQIIRGWVSIISRLPELIEPLQLACDWIISTADSITGRLMWNKDEAYEGIHLYVLKPLRDAARLLNQPHIEASANHALLYYLTSTNIMNFTAHQMPLHFYAYMQEALFELGCFDEAQQGMAEIAQYQQDNGAISGYHNAKWICATGLAQLAKVWYLLNDNARADQAMAFLKQLQNYSGGFYGSYGVNANFFPGEEISCAIKYVIDAEHLRMARYYYHHFPSMQTEPNS